MKKLLSLLLALTLAASTLAISTTALADTTVTMKYSVCDGGVFTFEPTDISVTADLSDKYADEIGYNDTITQPSILDATIAVHIAMFGEDFMDYAPLLMYSSGWIYSAFGEATSNTTYRLNAISCYSMDEAVANGDYVEFGFYQDYMCSDRYISFNTTSVSALTGEEVILSATAEGYDSSWSIVNYPASNLTITVNDEEVGTTDDNGKIALSFDKVGTYKISASGTLDDYPIFLPYCEIKVSENKFATYLEAQMNGGAQYLLGTTSTITVASANDYLTYLKSGYDMSKYKNDFLASAEDILKKNDSTNDDLGLYGALIEILRIYDINPEDFNGYNVVAKFNSLEPNQISNPYYYRVAIETADEEFALRLCEQFITDYYTMGKGMNYWGYSCDNTAVFLTSIAKYGDSYKDIVNDAKAVIDSYTTANGCFYNNTYTDVNSDSTATALMAYSAIGDTAKAFKLYKNLVEGFESTTKGVFLYNGDKNYFATKDSLLALEYLYNLYIPAGLEHSEHICTTAKTNATTSKNGSIVKTCKICGKVTSSSTIYYAKSVTLNYTTTVYSGKAKTPTVTVKDSNNKAISSSNYTVSYKNNKNVGTATVTIKLKGNYSGTITKTFKITPKGTKIKSASGKAKSFKVAWSKQATQTTGYQIQYATDKKFTKNVKTANIKDTKTTSTTIKKLKWKKTYYVRIRTYKTVDGKKVYSGWSTVKSVKTK